MEAAGWFRGLAPVAALVVLGGLGALGRPPVLGAADPPWQPPPCPEAAPTTARPAAVTWYRVDPVLDGTGTLAGQRLVVGSTGRRPRALQLPPESFASGPVEGRLLVGEDDGSTSRLRILDLARGCSHSVATEDDVIRSAVLSPDGTTIWEHRVDRVTRADLGIWRRAADPAPAAPEAAVRVLAGMAVDERYGPTFATELRLGADGRLAVASCGEMACRSRILEPRTGRVRTVDATGPVIGVDGDTVIAYDLCHGYPCPIVAVDAPTGQRTALVDDAGPASLAGAGRSVLVFEARQGLLDTLNLRTGARLKVEAPSGLLPVHDGSTATSGADLPPGDVLVAPDGRVADPASARVVDPLTSTVMGVEEAVR